MTRNIRYLRAGGVAPGRIRSSDIAQTVRSRFPAPSQASERRILSLDQRRPNLEDSVDEMLSSALVAQDKELAHILEEVDKISKTLKSQAPDAQTLSNTLQRTVLCAVKQSLLDRELRSLALTDDLTCLYNRRAFFALAGQQLRVTRRKAQGLLLFFADVNNLKEINDTYGHDAGDRALRAVGAVLRSTVRETDLCARFAGDEFIVVLWDCSPEHEAIRVSAVQNAVSAYPFEPRPGVRVSLSISAGAARFPEDGGTFEELLAAADERMYRDKAGHRSRNSGRHALTRAERA